MAFGEDDIMRWNNTTQQILTQLTSAFAQESDFIPEVEVKGHNISIGDATGDLPFPNRLQILLHVFGLVGIYGMDFISTTKNLHDISSGAQFDDTVRNELYPNDTPQEGITSKAEQVLDVVTECSIRVTAQLYRVDPAEQVQDEVMMQITDIYKKFMNILPTQTLYSMTTMIDSENTDHTLLKPMAKNLLKHYWDKINFSIGNDERIKLWQHIRRLERYTR